MLAYIPYMDPMGYIVLTSFRRTIAAVAKAELWAKAQWLLDESQSRGSRPDASPQEETVVWQCLALPY